MDEAAYREAAYQRPRGVRERMKSALKVSHSREGVRGVRGGHGAPADVAQSQTQTQAQTQTHTQTGGTGQLTGNTGQSAQADWRRRAVRRRSGQTSAGQHNSITEREGVEDDARSRDPDHVSLRMFASTYFSYFSHPLHAQYYTTQ